MEGQSRYRATGFSDYTVRVSPRAKRVILKVIPGKGLEVVVPRGFNQRRLPAILQSKRSWIEQTLIRLGKEEELVVPTHICLKAVDEHWQVQYQPTSDSGVSVRQRTTNLLSVEGDVGDVYLVTEVLKRWLSLRARFHLVPWLTNMSHEFGFPFKKSIVRGQSTRWASCSKLQTISLNRGLLFLPGRLVRHVFLHELCHTRHLDHSPKFWSLLGGLKPNCGVLEAQVRQADHYVPKWAHPR